jgi:hypothetical protein
MFQGFTTANFYSVPRYDLWFHLMFSILTDALVNLKKKYTSCCNKSNPAFSIFSIISAHPFAQDLPITILDLSSYNEPVPKVIAGLML